MGLDYYGILNLKRDCATHDVKQAFRRLALKYNPERHEHGEDMMKIFSLIAEAYDVLVDPLKRAVFDQFGEESLKKGVPGPKHFIQPYAFHGEPMRTFREFFGTSNPYADLLSYYENPLPMFESPYGRGYKAKDSPIARPLALSLTEVYFGGVKKMKIQRLVFTDEKCTELKLREKVLSIPVNPGVAPGTEIVFREEGDQGPTRVPADVIFVTEDRPHERFIRLGTSDLLMVCSVTLEEVLSGVNLTIKTVDDRTLKIPVTDIIRPTYEKIIESEGLPLANCPDKKGNLIIRFSITFPDYIARVGKEALQKAFKVCKEHGITYEPENINRYILADKLQASPYNKS